VILTIASEDFEVSITPHRGADIVGITERATGVQLLAVSPTGDVGASVAATGNSMEQWMRGYPGGWQILAPNAGPERVHDGVTQGYHGEASLAQWQVLNQGAASVTLATSLITSPLKIERAISVAGACVTVEDVVTNPSTEPCSFRLVQHPAFGSTFLDEHSYLAAPNATLVADAAAPGTLTHAGAVGPPASLLPAGPIPNSIALPGPGSRHSLFGALTDFTSDEESSDTVAATFFSPTHGFGIQLSGDPSTYPHAWFWIEANAGTGWPWFRRHFSIAVEPSNVLPSEGHETNGFQRGGLGTTLAGGSSLSSIVRMTRVPLPTS